MGLGSAMQAYVGGALEFQSSSVRGVGLGLRNERGAFADGVVSVLIGARRGARHFLECVTLEGTVVFQSSSVRGVGLGD